MAKYVYLLPLILLLINMLLETKKHYGVNTTAIVQLSRYYPCHSGTYDNTFTVLEIFCLQDHEISLNLLFCFNIYMPMTKLFWPISMHIRNHTS